MTKYCLLPLLLIAACATRSSIEQSREQARLGQYARAFVILDDLRNAELQAGHEVDPGLESAWLAAKKDFLRNRAQELVFEERENEALADLVELESMDPEFPGIETVRSRAFAKRAMRVMQQGEDSLVRKEFVQAMACFLESRAIIAKVEGQPITVKKVEDGTKAGIDAVGAALAQLSDRGQQQFLEAVRKLPEFRYVEVQWHANNVIHNTPDRTEAKAIESKARRENALKSMARGRECETQGRFGAALLEYRAAKELDKDVPGVDAAIVAMDKEQQAARMIEVAQRYMRAGRYDDARAELAKAFELSVMARNEIGARVTETRRLEAQRNYQAARDAEVLGKKAEALALFEVLLKDWPDGFSDEKGRADALKIDIEGARTEWAAAEAAEAAGDLPKALDHYINSERFYAGWKDGKARIARLRDAIKPPAGSGGSQP